MKITQANSNIRRPTISRVSRLVTTCLALTGLAACGDDAKASSRSKEAFCSIEKQADDSFNAAFEDLGDNPTAEEEAATLVDLSKSITERFRDDYVSTAPTEMLDDATLLWDAAERAAAGNPQAYDEPAVVAALGRVDTYCYGPSTS